MAGPVTPRTLIPLISGHPQSFGRSSLERSETGDVDRWWKVVVFCASKPLQTEGGTGSEIYV